jgi:hypothetical protein
MIATPEFISTWRRRPVAISRSQNTSLIPVFVVHISTIEVSTAATPEPSEEPSAGVPRSHPIPACVRRTHPISAYPGVPSAKVVPISVHPVVTRAWLRRPLVGVAWRRRRRRSIDALGATVEGRVSILRAIARVAGVLAVVVVLAISILRVIVRVTLIRSILLRIFLRVLLRVLLTEHDSFQASRKYYNCHPVALHNFFPFPNALFRAARTH